MIERYAAYWCLVVFWIEWLICLWLLWTKTRVDFFRRWLIRFSKIMTPALYLMYRMDQIRISRRVAAKSIDGLYCWLLHQYVKSWEIMAFQLIPVLTLLIAALIFLPILWRRVRLKFLIKKYRLEDEFQELEDIRVPNAKPRRRQPIGFLPDRGGV